MYVCPSFLFPKLQRGLRGRKYFIPFLVVPFTAFMFFIRCYLMYRGEISKTPWRGWLNAKPPLYTAIKKSIRLKDFQRDWLRKRRARVDWQGMMESCKDDMA